MARAKLETLTEQMYYVLLALTDPGHGYAVMERIEALSRKRVQVGPGTLYTLLARFEKEGLIALVKEEDKRKVYRLTEQGWTVLRKEYGRLRRQAEDGAAILGGENHEKNDG
ncbi:MAG: PadR family transcriptional regulator [Oscillospiraceae bacterium]|nr:PadR family transcriptional regulator [Oscillospiraceae bacterium]